jgi:RNA 2',3'-cyclic 3'-phosphodiesterase
MIRLFVALGLPDDLRDELSAMCGGIPGARWVPEENYHLTLRFIGEVPGWQAQEVDEALSGIRAPGFELTLRGLGTFQKSGRVSALWVGVEKTEPLVFLQSKVETALQRIGLEPERRRFAPHVTLARTDKAEQGKVIAFVQAHNLFRAAPVPVEDFALYSSRLGKEQAAYAREVEYGLLDPKPAAAAALRA